MIRVTVGQPGRDQWFFGAALRDAPTCGRYPRSGSARAASMTPSKHGINRVRDLASGTPTNPDRIVRLSHAYFAAAVSKALEFHSSLSGKDTLALGAWDLRRAASRKTCRYSFDLPTTRGRRTGVLELAKTCEPSKQRTLASISAACGLTRSYVTGKNSRGYSLHGGVRRRYSID